MDVGRLEREVRVLKVYVFATTVLATVTLLSGFMQAGPAAGASRAKFTEIDVERINVLEPDGSYRMVISNRARSIGPIFKGTPFGYPGGTRPGIIFFNDEGTENGGLTFGGKRESDGSFRSSGHLSFDQYEQDQVVYLQYQDDNGRRRMGLTVADRADVSIYDVVRQRDSVMRMTDSVARNAALRQVMGPRNGQPMFAQRAFLGRDLDRNAVVNLADAQGRTRLRLVVDSLGTARIEFLDANGGVMRRITNR